MALASSSPPATEVQDRPDSVQPSRITEGALRRALIARANTVRASHGLARLYPSELLRASSQLHAMDMIERNYFSHIDKERRDPGERLQALRPEFSGVLYENLYHCSLCLTTHSHLAERVIEGFIQSPRHREALLTRNAVAMDFGVAIGESEVYVVQLLGREE